MKKNFVFLLGTQKAGTTFTTRLIQNHPQVSCGGIKEMRYWKNFFKEEEWKKNFIKNNESRKNKKWRIRSENLKEGNFSKYFSRYSKSKESKILKCAADMTPSNGTLSEKQLKIAYEAILNNGYKIKPIYLMRDPIERLWSQTKMQFFNKYMNKKQKKQNKFDKTKLFDLFTSLSKDDFEDKDTGRTRYDLIIPRIEKVFKEEKIFFYFSEKMREENFKSDLFSFLEIDYLLPKKKVLGNPSDIPISSNEIPKIHLEEVFEIFKPVYLYVYDKFKEKTPKNWISKIQEF